MDLDERTRAHERGGVVVERHVEVEAGPVGPRAPGIEQLRAIRFLVQPLVVPDRPRQLRLEPALLLVAGGDDPAVALRPVGVDQCRVERLLVSLERRLDWGKAGAVGPRAGW